MAELADAHDSNSCSFGSVGSIPTFGISILTSSRLIICLAYEAGKRGKASRDCQGKPFLVSRPAELAGELGGGEVDHRRPAMGACMRVLAGLELLNHRFHLGNG